MFSLVTVHTRELAPEKFLLVIETFSVSEGVNPQHNSANDKSLGASFCQSIKEQSHCLKPVHDKNVHPQDNRACDENLGTSSCQLDENKPTFETSLRQEFESQDNTACDESLGAPYI